ncbi:stage II sporulation protein E [Paenibacillus baekrokdamisoli]|uniref:Stage II sporulation protein E n=1 Tax=Paenibacillus baekrokdamisoli TaxID=1712516 RepID=A0A3G9JED8_9BACL|nr:stage II sporulation protein E [Paenibacillus baekrokdamisoli]MBB3073001.1 stage II sporulation protein E [Paenibacillus baekrokdamisoli]BBH23333.1 stage II sporulation protein E [Paenibacillus baekrokdamisoli]
MTDKHNVVMFPGVQRTSLVQAAVQKGMSWSAIRQLVQLFSTRKWTFVLMTVGFLLGRAVILESLTPFAIAYFAVIYFLRRDAYRPVALSIVAGSFLAVTPEPMWIAMELAVVFLLLKGLEAYERAELSYAPMLVFLSTLLVRLFGVVIADTLSWYELMMVTVEAALSFVLTLVFVQAIPVLTMTRKSAALKNEEIICLMILLASVMTGAVGWTIYGMSVEHIMSRFMLLLFALVGGAPLGASVGVVAGLILSLADMNAIVQMSLLAFAGLLAGLLREGGKMAVAFGMLLGSSILSIYLGNQTDVMASTWESVAAAILLLLTPRSIIRTLSKYVPGTQEHVKSQHEYARRVRDVTAQRVSQFSEVFRQLSRSFGQINVASNESDKREETVGHFMNAAAEKTCNSCHRKELCWEGKFYDTYKMMTNMMTAVEDGRRLGPKEVPKEWSVHCLRSHQVLDVMQQQYEMFKHDQHWRKQLNDSRQLVAEQLSGVSQVMEDLAREIQREGQQLHLQEEQIREALEGLGLSIHGIDVVNLEEGNVELEVYHTFARGYDECRKIIAPLLTDILGEPIAVMSERYSDKSGEPTLVVFGSAKAYEVETGVAGVAKGGDLLSGDSFSTVELGNGKFAVAISDGMGNGERAKQESSTALSILQQLLQSGMDEKLAIKSVNSVLLLRSSDEVFATVDVALIDMYTAKTTFMKIGSTPSFIKRGSEVISISANNLPVGILQDIDVDLIRVQLLPGDTLIMMTDGIYDAPGHAVNKEMWMKRVIQEIRTDNPQEIADCLLDTVVRYHNGDIVDDMTVVVARVDKHQPEWATFRWPGMTKVERPRTVS